MYAKTNTTTINHEGGVNSYQAFSVVELEEEDSKEDITEIEASLPLIVKAGIDFNCIRNVRF